MCVCQCLCVCVCVCARCVFLNGTGASLVYERVYMCVCVCVCEMFFGRVVSFQLKSNLIFKLSWACIVFDSNSKKRKFLMIFI